ncbi:MAG TPA: C1 family peptidase [Verrucomicrobiae bacterium]|jgi:hypothetical protein
MLNPKTGQQGLSLLAHLPGAPRFRQEALDKLAEDFSITTVEEFYARARVAESRRARSLLGESVWEPGHEMLVQTLEPLVRAKTRQQFEQVSRWEYSFGAQLDTMPLPAEREPDLLREVGPPWFGREISLINSYMPAIRNQLHRATSVAFATCAAMEYIFARERNLRLDLSEQWQYWNCKRCDGEPKSQGTSLRWSFYLAARDGICEEEHWPYDVMDDPSNRDPNPPPSAAVNAVKHKMPRFIDVPAPKDVNVLKGLLSRGQPIAFAIPMFASVEEDVNTRLTGNILVPAETETPLPLGHAMVLVGYADDAEFAGGGYFIVRNSWGTRWGSQCPFGAGYGTIPYRFIERYNHCALAPA